MSSDEDKVVQGLTTQIKGLKSLDSVKLLQEVLRNVSKEIRATMPKTEESKGGQTPLPPRVDENIDRKVYVTNVSPETSLEQLKEYLGGAGTISFAKFTYKGFKMRKASIEFEKKESVK